jgi:hypothetical protein
MGARLYQQATYVNDMSYAFHSDLPVLRGYATGTYRSPGQNRASGQRSGAGRDTVRGQTGRDLAVQAQWLNAAAGRQRAGCRTRQ